MKYSAFAATFGLILTTPAIAAGDDLAASAAAAQDPSAAERAALLREIEALRARVTALEHADAQAQAQAAPPPSGPSTIEKVVRDHNLELYGFIQVDAIQDFDRVNPDWEATLRPSRIPTIDGQFGSDGQTIFSVRQSRLGAKANGIIADKPYEAKLEFDLYGTGDDAGQTTIRFRHAYASWGPLLVGQTNTLWMDGDIFPNVIDYWGPTGMVFVRNPQIRYTFVDSGGWKAAVALEHLTHDVDTGSLRLIDEDLASSIRNDEKLPDLTAMVRYGGDWGHVQLAGIARKVGYDTADTEDNEPKGSEFGWGLNLTSAIPVSLATFRLGAVYGKGIASYMNDGGMDLAPSVDVEEVPGSIVLIPSAEAVKLLGLSAYVDLAWNKQFSSALGYSFTKVDNSNFQDATAFHKGEYASANLLYTPADRIMTGIEFLWGKRTDNDGESGTDFRVQTSFKFNFSSKDIWD